MTLAPAFSRSPALRGAVRRLLLLALAGTALAAQAMDDPPGRIGRIAEVQGRGWLMEAGQSEWGGLVRNRPVTTGDRLSTERGARLELEIGSTTARLDGGTEVQVLRLDDDRIELQLVSGSLALRTRELEVSREVEIVLREGRYQPRLPGLYRIDREGRGSFGAALSGELMFDAPDSALALRGGQRAEFWFDPADRRTHYTWAALPQDDFAWWVQREDARDEQVAAQRPISSEMTGGYDLDRYGRWSTHPEYGSIWTPIGVAAGWAPYRYGHWSWVAPWGWTWIDDAPWGFAPFHYGRWVFFAGQWCWAPGQYVRRPVYAPAMVAWVGGGSVSVSVGVGPSVGWIPLAPREPYLPPYGVSNRYWQHLNSPHGQWNSRPQPAEPMMYTNRGVPGGVTVLPSNALAQRQPVPVAPRRVDDGTVTRWLRSDPVRLAPPPAPTEVRVAPRQPGGPAADPQPRSLAPVSPPVVRGDAGPGPRGDTSPAGSVGATPNAGREWRSRTDLETPAPRGELPVRPAVQPAPQPVPQVQQVQQVPQPQVVPAQRAPQPAPVGGLSPGRGAEAVPAGRAPVVPVPAAQRPRDDDRGSDRGGDRGDRRSVNRPGGRQVE